VGENGAGKSTLMKILLGLHKPDRGEIHFQGERIHLRNPHDALKRGIAMIHQELQPFPDLTVAENIFMGQEQVLGFFGWLDKRSMNRDAASLLARLGVELAPTTKMWTLSVAEMQTVEIAKALVHQAQVIIMDEPTSAISDREVDRLFSVIRDLKERGVAVIYISHRLEEIFRIADCVTVLRDGRYIATHAIGDLTPGKLIALLVGRELTSIAPRARAEKQAEVALAVSGLTKAGKFRDVSFEVRRGEIVGIAGLMGAGRTDLLHALFGLAPAEGGEIHLHGQKVRLASPATAIARGLALVTEDRKEHGLVLKMSVKHNLTLSNLRQCSRGLFLDHRAESRIAQDRIKTFSIKTPSADQSVNYLSGGNQQKVVLAKALLTEPAILLLDEPTRGIDIGAKTEIYALITQLAQEGKAILMVSSELPEILSLSDRVLVMREGVIAAELNPRQTSQEEIMTYAMPK
jgi:inositol transport system ATP-binding protein